MRLLSGLLSAVAAAFAAGTLWAGGSGLNVIVVVNQNSTNSVQLGNDYREQRGVPPQNVFRMTGWTGGATTWSRTDFEGALRNPLLAMLAARGLTNQVEYVLLSMDIPFYVADGDSVNSTTAALFYGFKYNSTPPPQLPVTCSLPEASSNSYCYSELPFPSARPDTATTNSFLAMMLTDSTLAGAASILERGVGSDSTFPTQAVYLAKTTDSARNVRYLLFDNALFEGRVLGDYSLVRLDTNGTGFTNLLGLQTGLYYESFPTNAFLPGAIADTLTSTAGLIFGGNGQTPLLAFLEAGAAGSYGTVTEPCNYLQKFPDPMDYIYQLRGFSLAEAYYQSVQNPYQGLMAGEPLSAPFARPGAADWGSLTNGAVLRGQVPVNLSFFAAAANLPLAQADLFVDGTFYRTMTNLPPSPGNQLSVSLNGFTMDYSVPTNATVASTAAGLASALNAQTNMTQVHAQLYGDRLELESLDLANPGSTVLVQASATVGSAPQLTTALTPARPAFLDTIATGYHYLFVSNSPSVGDWLQLAVTKTNGASFSFGATNTSAGTSIGQLLTALTGQINAAPGMQSADGLYASDYLDYNVNGQAAAEVYLYACSPGWPAAQLQVTLTASSNLLVLGAGLRRLDDNLSDLRPRNHLLVSSGSALLPINWTLDTSGLPDGFHQLTAVAYEGTSVSTQTRITRTVRIQNTALTATLTPLLVGTNATLDTPLQFTVIASATNISRIELFSTGGSLGVSSNQPSVVFTVPSATLGLGLHPFYALVTDTTGNRYQTEVVEIRLVPSFKLGISNPPLALFWPAIPGQDYDVLATTNLSSPFQTVTSVMSSNTVIQWPIPTAAAAGSFYRVRLSP